MGYVEQGFGGLTELRVHGVSGTPPEAMLRHPHVARVAGNGQAGFFRRSWEAESVSDDTARRRVEAYEWGGLTSGGWTRALWLLLLPFMLANVAFYMGQATQLDDARGAATRTVRRAGEAAQRVVALGLTLTLTLATISVSVDLVGWQCARTGTTCGGGAWLPFLGWSWLQGQGTRLAVTAIVPLATVLLLWWLARSTWAVSEQVEPPRAAARDREHWRTPLESRDFWRDRGRGTRLRSVHVAAALAVVGLSLTAPLLRSPDAGPGALLDGHEWSRPGGWVPAVLTGLLLVALAVAVLAVLQPRLTERLREPDDDGGSGKAGRPGEPGRVFPEQWLLRVTTVLAGLAWIAALLAPAGGYDPARDRPRATMLPWSTGSGLAVFTALLLAVAVLAVVCIAQRSLRASRATQVTRSAPGGIPVPVPVAWAGLGPVALVVVAWSVAGAFAAALTLRGAQFLGTPLPATDGSEASGNELLLPLQHIWTGASTTVLVALIVMVVLGAAVLLRLRRGGASPEARAAYREFVAAGDEAAEQRLLQVSRSWAAARISDLGTYLVGLLALAGAMVVGLMAVTYLAAPESLLDLAPGLASVGNLVLTAGILGLLYLGRLTYSNPEVRRTVGVLWDLGTFWPRSTHPLAPPCYAERTLPDLLTRIDRYRAEGGQVVLSCHSQGTVIGAATVAGSTFEAVRDVALLTYGSPLARLYAGFFPAYLGLEPLLRIGALLEGAAPGPVGPDVPVERRRRWPWVNLYRLSDPIGGPILVRYPAVQYRAPAPEPAPEPVVPVVPVEPVEPAAPAEWPDLPDVDREFVDPLFAKPAGDTCYPATLGHSDYELDRAFADALRVVVERRRAAAPWSGAGPGVGAGPVADPGPGPGAGAVAAPAVPRQPVPGAPG